MSTPLTKEIARQYLGGMDPDRFGKCPFCGSEQTMGDYFEPSDGHIYQEMRCLDCGAEWNDQYRLEGISDRSGDVVFYVEDI